MACRCQVSPASSAMPRQPQLEAGKSLLPLPTPWRAARKHGSPAQCRSVVAVLTAFAAAAAAAVVGSGLAGSGLATETPHYRGFRSAFSFEEAFLRDGAAANGRIVPWAGSLPTLGALRSKILLLQDFEAAGGPYGLALAGPQMALEDSWIVPDVYHLADKWVLIRKALECAADALLPHEPNGTATPLFLAHVSASVGVLPIEAAAGPIKRSVTGLNDMTGQWLLDYGRNPEARRTGIVIFDFPGRRAIDAVLAWNRRG